MGLVGKVVKIEESYKPYKSARGQTGKVIWEGKVGARLLYQIRLDKKPPQMRQDTCFSLADDLEIVNQEVING